MRNVYLTFVLVIGVFFQLLAAPTISWIGAADTDWNNPANWSTGVVPGPTDDILLAGGTIDLSTVTTVRSVDITSGADLTITGTGVLNIAGDTGICGNQGAIDLGTPSGTLTNSGVINITNGANDGIYVTNNGAIFTNRGTININTVGDDGIFMSNSSFFNNTGDIVITGTAGDGIDTRGTFTNTATGTIDISNLTGGRDGILVDDNNGFQGVFQSSGLVTVNMSGSIDEGVYVTDGSTFMNTGTLNVFSTGCAGDIGISVDDLAMFTNGATGVLNVMDTADESIFIDFDGQVDNYGFISTANAGICIPSANHGIEVKGIFNNNAGATFKDSNSDGDAIRIESAGVLTNAGALILDITGATSDAIENKGAFSSTGAIEIGCTGTINELEVNNGDLDLGTSCVTFDIGGTGSGGTDYDRFEIRGTVLDPTMATAKLVFDPAYVPQVGDCFKIVDGNSDGTGTVAGLFGLISSPFPVTQTIQNADTEIEICVEAPLAVELTNLDVMKTERGAKLFWETATEVNNDGFDIERSVDAISWTKVGFVAGNVNSNGSSRYDYLDTNPVQGTNYYRLKQFDLDGTSSYSAAVSVDFENETTEPISVYPNPVSEVLFLDIDKEAETVEIELFDYSGKLLFSRNSAINQIPFDGYDAGIYILKLSIDSDLIIQKIIK